MIQRPSKVRANIALLSERASEHQAELDAVTTYFKPKDLATRWGCSCNTVRAIPFDALPYINIGQGLSRELRRYPPANVYAYEARRLSRTG